MQILAMLLGWEWGGGGGGWSLSVLPEKKGQEF